MFRIGMTGKPSASLQRRHIALGRLSLGCAQLGNLYREVSDADALATVDRAWQLGIRYFDTAPHYGLGRFLLLAVGLAGVLITSTTAMGQMERGLNRIYGIEHDRPTLRKYVLALVLTVTVGTGLGIAFLMLGFGRSIGSNWGEEARVTWEVLRWPVGLALIAVCLATIFGHSANRRQPGRAWLGFGAGVAVALWALSTIGLALVFRLASNFGETYGPLAGIVALQIWTFLSAFSIFYGVAVAAELEAIRAGVGVAETPRDDVPAPTVRASLQS
jgi:uncharacterized BrkB/YihY/UPF0761 family membrane protein